MPRLPAEGWRRGLEPRWGASVVTVGGSPPKSAPGARIVRRGPRPRRGTPGPVPCPGAVPAARDLGSTGVDAGQRRLPLRPPAAPAPLPVGGVDPGRRLRRPVRADADREQLLPAGHGALSGLRRVAAAGRPLRLRTPDAGGWPGGGVEGRDAEGGAEPRVAVCGATRSRCASAVGGTTCCRWRRSGCQRSPEPETRRTYAAVQGAAVALSWGRADGADCSAVGRPDPRSPVRRDRCAWSTRSPSRRPRHPRTAPSPPPLNAAPLNDVRPHHVRPRPRTVAESPLVPPARAGPAQPVVAGPSDRVRPPRHRGHRRRRRLDGPQHDRAPAGQAPDRDVVHLRLDRRRRPVQLRHGHGAAVVVGGADPRRVLRPPGDHGPGGAGVGGPELLRPQRRGPRRCGPRPLPRPDRHQRVAAGRVDHHPAVREAGVPHRPSARRPESSRRRCSPSSSNASSTSARS